MISKLEILANRPIPNLDTNRSEAQAQGHSRTRSSGLKEPYISVCAHLGFCAKLTENWENKNMPSLLALWVQWVKKPT